MEACFASNQLFYWNSHILFGKGVIYDKKFSTIQSGLPNQITVISWKGVERFSLIYRAVIYSDNNGDENGCGSGDGGCDVYYIIIDLLASLCTSNKSLSFEIRYSVYVP